ncbi:ComE operon protein 3 [Kroppenstedtia guangzhouensis]|uniref:ComE operon protein 3 n=1 Tax=Kroppenstedtia guangzhouensis TaxID=1274356 RepID=A0ABQ1G4X4_9BACL|nr:DNA internalization-related competence protein ComEC/Rec2 [Kroppenstedtia guangzhouensis]GGA36722.1 ComE operon protein 3 [Kroppenstedtia guangzhouensis]
MKRPFFVLALGWAFGIGLGQWWGGTWLVWGGLGGAVLLVGGIGYYWRMRGLVLTLFFAGCFLGAAHFRGVDVNNRSQIPVPANSSVQAVVEGRMDTPAKVDGDRVELAIRSQRVRLGQRELNVEERIQFQFRLRNPGEKQAVLRLGRGTEIVTTAKLTRPDPPRNPGAFDYRGYLRRQGIHLLGEGNLRDVRILSETFSIRRQLDRLRDRLEERLDRLYPSDHAGLMKGMLLGDREAVPFETEENFRSLGLVHLLAISGLHVGVFVGCLYGILTWVGVTREKTAFICLLFLPFYAMLTGAGAPVIRAAVMAGMGLVAVILNRWKDSLSFLGLAALVMLWWNPYQLMEAGFQLSFMVTGALLVATGPLSRRIPTPWPRFNQLMAVTLIAQMASFPLLIYHFHEFSLLSFAVNGIVVPVMTALVIPLGMLSLVMGLFHVTLGFWPAWISSKLLSGVQYLLSFPASWTGFRIPWAPPSGMWMAGYTGSVLYLLWAWSGGGLRRARHGGLSWMIAIVVVIASLPGSVGGDRELRITFIDVGQGDATLIETPGGRVILVDGGGTLPWQKEPWQKRRKEFEVGRDVLVPYLKYRGIRRVDWMVMTHGDADHIGGLRAVVEELTVVRVLRNPLPPGTGLEGELMGTLFRRGIPVTVSKPGTWWEPEPGIRLQVLHPPVADPKPRSDNEASVVLLLTAFGHSVLLPADLEESGEQEILERWQLPRIDFLKVGHHGSRTSTGEKWLETLRPREAIISVGRGNRFGHPAPEVVDRLKVRGIRLWRTDQHGAIILRIRPQGVKVESMIPHSQGCRREKLRI